MSAHEPQPSLPAVPAPSSADGVPSPVRLVVLASGGGSNLLALLEACQDRAYGARVVGVVVDRPCSAVEHAVAAGVPAVTVALRGFADRASWDLALTEAVAAFEPGLVVCAGFMKILGSAFLARFGGRTLNTHPALLPCYPGAHAVRDALADGATRSGATLFWVDAGVDTGSVIAQVEVPVLPDDDETSLTARIKALETPQLVREVGRLTLTTPPARHELPPQAPTTPAGRVQCPAASSASSVR